MKNVDKIKYWIESADYDYATAETMLEGKRYLYVGFMCHLTIEKLLKASFMSINDSPPPFTHNLTDLAIRASIYNEMTEAQKDFLDLLQPLNIEARYPTHKDELVKVLTFEKCDEILNETKKLGQWIKKKLEI